jgi:hypothetical protein
VLLNSKPGRITVDVHPSPRIHRKHKLNCIQETVTISRG